MSLKLTAGYRLDLEQISRILQYCSDNQDKSLSRVVIAEGVGISAARLSRLWMMGTALGIFKRGTWSTERLGQLIYRNDPYLDDIGTLWLLHYILASNPNIVVWNCMSNEVVPNNRMINMETAKPHFADKMQEFSDLSYDVYLNKEIRSYFNAYTEQKFRDLEYLVSEDGTNYEWGNRMPIPAHIAFACVQHYRDHFVPKALTLDIEELTKKPNSLGLIFNISNRQVRDKLEEMEGLGHLYVETRADLDQIRFRDDIEFLDVINRYYEER